MFSDGQRISVGNLQLIYSRFYQNKRILFSVGVGKKEFHSSVLRNRVKRLLREVFRSACNGHASTIQPGEYFLLYKSSQLPTYDSLKSNLSDLFKEMNN